MSLTNETEIAIIDAARKVFINKGYRVEPPWKK
jgi:hypothetical protein